MLQTSGGSGWSFGGHFSGQENKAVKPGDRGRRRAFSFRLAVVDPLDSCAITCDCRLCVLPGPQIAGVLDGVKAIRERKEFDEERLIRQHDSTIDVLRNAERC